MERCGSKVSLSKFDFNDQSENPHWPRHEVQLPLYANPPITLQHKGDLLKLKASISIFCSLSMCRPGLLCPSGAFLPGLPVQPVVLRYTNSLVNTPPSSDPPSSLLPCRPHSPDFTRKRSPQEVAYGSEVTASVSSFPPG